MKITAMPSDLLEVLNQVLPAVGKTEITTCVRLKVSGSLLELSCSDGEISLATSLALNDCEEGDVCVIAKTFVDTLKKLDPDTQVKIKTLENNRISVCSGKFRNYLQYLDADIFPVIINENEISSATFKTQDLFTAIDGVKFCVASDSYRMFLKGANFSFNGDEASLISSNGHMMAFCKTSVALTNPVDAIIIPKRSLDVICGLLKTCQDDTVIIRIAKNSISMMVGSLHFNSTLIGAEFPHVTTMIDFTSNTRIIIDKNDFINSVKRVAITSNSLNKAVMFTLDGFNVKLASKNSKQEEAEDEIKVINYTGQSQHSTAFSAEYILNVLSKIDTPTFCINASSNCNNIRVTSCNSDDCSVKDNNIQSLNDNEYLFLISKIVV